MNMWLCINIENYEPQTLLLSGTWTHWQCQTRVHLPARQDGWFELDWKAQVCGVAWSLFNDWKMIVELHRRQNPHFSERWHHFRFLYDDMAAWPHVTVEWPSPEPVNVMTTTFHSTGRRLMLLCDPDLAVSDPMIVDADISHQLRADVIRLAETKFQTLWSTALKLEERGLNLRRMNHHFWSFFSCHVSSSWSMHLCLWPATCIIPRPYRFQRPHWIMRSDFGCLQLRWWITFEIWHFHV